MSSPSDRWCGSGGRAVGMRNRPFTDAFCSALRSASLPFSSIVTMRCSRSSAVDHESILMSTLAFAPVAMLLMLMANASISSRSCWARTGAVAGASSRTAAAKLNADGARLTDSSIHCVRTGLAAAACYWGGTTDTSSASVQVMSTLSPTFSLASASLSATLEL